jgi:hypothetical protein
MREGGWQIPGLTQFTKSENRSQITVNGVKVIRQYLKSSDEPLIIIDQYSLSDAGELIISPTPCYIRNIMTYSVSGRVFAYQVSGMVAVKNTAGRLERTGGVLEIFFYDEDGEGKFETRSIATELQRVPSWAVREVFK